ncbi:outer membrane lipid asymmetry maintenance protein MlaD [Yunchengibacter salinarum]|uniref:outer membrane lipid asymmetry maintenance protein MlaD n=1 Tax=Yunchengibacter salinarum TaxID=3133399 RepID=UPI0035B60F60
MSSNLIESVIGALVLVVAGWFLVFAYDQSEASVGNGYTLQARFDKIDGLTMGGDVRLSGIKVGTVVDQRIDPKTYQAVVTFSVRNGIDLPTDTAVAVTSESLLGGKYLAVIPGGMPDMLAPGDEISETQDSVDLMGLIGKFMVSDSGGNESGGNN